MKELSVKLPNETASNIDERYLEEALIATLYHNQKLSEKEARKALGMTRRDFEEMLPRYGFSVLVDSEENARIELNA